MTLLWCDGARYGGNSKYDAVSGSAGYHATAGFDNGLDKYAFKIGINPTYWEKRIPARDEIIVGIRFWLPTQWSGGNSMKIFSFLDDTVGHIDVYLDVSTYQVTVQRGAAVLDTSSPVASASGEWVYLEIRIKIDDAAGEVEVRAYGVTKLLLSAVDTRNGGTATMTRVRMGRSSSTNIYDHYADDYYILDKLGAVNNDFLATTTHTPQVFDLAPVGAGDVTNFTPTGVAANWDAVNDTGNADNDTTYIASNTVGDKDLYQIQDLPAGVLSIAGITQWAVWRKDDATGRFGAMTIRSGASDDDSPDVGLTNSYLPSSRTVEADPVSGVAFTPSDINALQIGAKVAA